LNHAKLQQLFFSGESGRALTSVAGGLGPVGENGHASIFYFRAPMPMVVET